MYCTSCRSEYRPGIERCSECGSELLTGDLPDPPDLRLKEPPPDPVTVFTSRDPALFPVARSILEGEELPFFVRGEELQDLFGIGRIGLGFNPIVGPIEIQVSAADAERARELLAEVELHDAEPDPTSWSAGDAADDEADGTATPPRHDAAGAPAEGRLATPRARRGFRLLVLAYLALVVRKWIVVPRWWQEFPETLWEQVEAYFRPSDLSRTIDSLLWLELPAALVISVGLLTFSPPARQLYLALWAWSFVSYALGGPGFGHGFSSALGLLTLLLGGAILALAFYGPIAEVFAEKKAARRRRRPPPRATSPE